MSKQQQQFSAATRLHHSDNFAIASRRVELARRNAKLSVGTPREAEAHIEWAKAERKLRQIGKERLQNRASTKYAGTSPPGNQILH